MLSKTDQNDSKEALIYTKRPRSDPKLPPKCVKCRQNGRKVARLSQLELFCELPVALLILLLAAVACTFSIFGPTRPAHIRIICPMRCQIDPKVTQSHPHKPKITPNDPKVPPS